MNGPSPLREDFRPLPLPPCELGEAPLWHPQEAALYWVDIPGRAVHRWQPATGAHLRWPQPSEPAALFAQLGGGVWAAMRDGLWALDAQGRRRLLEAPPYDPSRQRFNDGRADATGRLWIGTLDDQRAPAAQLHRRQAHGAGFQPMLGGLANVNGVAFSPDGARLHLADTGGHALLCFDLDLEDGSLSGRRVWQRFEPRGPGQPLATYGGRPDGAAMDSEGHLWVAMYEGQRLLRLAPDGRVSAQLPLPVRCPTMPCFGGPDLRTLYLTTARAGRPAQELQAQPWAGCVLQARVHTPGLPTHLVG